MTENVYVATHCKEVVGIFKTLASAKDFVKTFYPPPSGEYYIYLFDITNDITYYGWGIDANFRLKCTITRRPLL